MTSLRSFLLVLLVLLLPVRGTVAAALLCPGAGHAAMGVAAPAMHDDGDDGTGEHEDCATAHAASCNLCASCCAMPPLPSTTPTLHEPVAIAAAGFPSPQVPAASGRSNPQDRPPRGC